MRVLVVEDERRLAEGLAKGLRAEGFAVDVAGDGSQGLWAARENPYDVVVLDVMLPYLNGYQVCAALRAEDNWVPILMLTAKDGEWDQIEGLDTGADDYLTKPVSFAVLLAHLRALIRRGRAERPTVLTAGDLTYDPAARTAARAGVEIALTARQAALLEHLLRHKGEVVTKAQIMAHVWDEHYEGDGNIVEVFVRQLRERIDRPFGRAAIQTVRGAGYRLAGDGG